MLLIDIERDAFDRGKILTSRKSSLSWPTSLEKQQQKSYLSKLQFALQDIVLERIILRTKSKKTPCLQVLFPGVLLS